MGSSSFKFVGFVLLLVFAVFYGVSLAGSGIERIQGPYVEEGHSSALTIQSDVQPSPRKEIKSTPVKKDKPIHFRYAKPGLLEHIAHKTGTLLQILADHSIRAVVRLFDKMLD